MITKNDIEKINIHDQIKQAKRKGMQMVRVPLLTNLKLVDGKLQYDIERYIVTPAHFISDENRNLN
ncbi:hypothetical protein [Peribacillus loiseleuriae]|uniref:Uncharacterized protein n=1 Tax=Peribacillus loiseleuriae TaxID=1679170 RepID=A0A0K9GRA8_9BACI|nr:hypothetical protein [Peribacillus loiseleuriae]KMY49195.1 hypothetical protein AC625_06395 [Peribacillus loiseleuriae]